MIEKYLFNHVFFKNLFCFYAWKTKVFEHIIDKTNQGDFCKHEHLPTEKRVVGVTLLGFNS